MSGYVNACLYVAGWVCLNGMFLLTEKCDLYNYVDDNFRYTIDKVIDKIKERFRNGFCVSSVLARKNWHGQRNASQHISISLSLGVSIGSK